MFGLKVKATVLAALMILSAGCGKGEYEALITQKMNQLSFASKFLETLHQDPTEVVVDVASLRLPAYIEDGQTYRMGAKDRRGDAISPQRIQPPFMNIPGFHYCYENYVDLGGRNETHPVYCYIASVPVKDQKENTLRARIRANLRKTFPSAEWQNAELDTPDGGKLAYKKLSVKGQQAFEMNSEGGEVRKVPGQFDIYVHSSPDVHVIIGFRASDQAASKVKVFETAEFALGTLTVESLDEDS